MAGRGTHVVGTCAVLRLQPVGESDVIVGLLSASEGRLEAVARGGRNSHKRFAGALQPFQLAEATVQPGRGALPLLRELRPVRTWLREEVSWPRLCLAAWATELAAVASQPSHADPALLDWLLTAWDAAALLPDSDPGRLRQLRLGLLLTLLALVGAMPDLQACTRCGRDLQLGTVWPPDADAPLCVACTPAAGRWLLAEPLRSAVVDLLRGQTALQTLWLPPDSRPLLEDRTDRLLQHALPGQRKSEPHLRALLVGA